MSKSMGQVKLRNMEGNRMLLAFNEFESKIPAFVVDE